MGCSAIQFSSVRKAAHLSEWTAMAGFRNWMMIQYVSKPAVFLILNPDNLLFLYSLSYLSILGGIMFFFILASLRILWHLLFFTPCCLAVILSTVICVLLLKQLLQVFDYSKLRYIYWKRGYLRAWDQFLFLPLSDCHSGIWRKVVLSATVNI